MEDDKQEKINDALLKVALGGSIAEVTEEYAEVDGALKLTKRKKTKRDVPPDLKALQLLLSEHDTDYSAMSDEELEREKLRLVAALQGGSVGKSDGAEAAQTVSAQTPKKTVKKSVAVKKKAVTAAKPRKSSVTAKTKKTGAGI